MRPTILTVNGQAKGTVFSPDPQFNLYTITGCMFGDVQGQSYIYGAFAAGQVALQIEFWSDTHIVAKVNPQVTGELDQANVTLVVVPSGASQVQKPGFKFYAMRETTLLTKIPAGAVSFAPLTDTGGRSVPSAIASPGDGTYGFGGMSASVVRFAHFVFPGGQDLFDFGKLRPGFTTENMQLQTWTLPSTGGDSYQVQGAWNAEWVGDNIRVSFQMQHYHESAGLSGGGDIDVSESHYGLSVWVSGPKGVSPWPN